MDTQTGEMSICEERSGQLVCKLAADERSAFQDEIDRLQTHRVKALEERVAELENSLSRPNSKRRLPTEEEFDKTMGYMERFFRGFMDIVKDLSKEAAQATPEPNPQQTLSRQWTLRLNCGHALENPATCRLKSLAPPHNRPTGPRQAESGMDAREGHLPSGYKFVIADDHPLFRGALKQALAGLRDVADHSRGRRFRERQGAGRRPTTMSTWCFSICPCRAPAACPA